MGKITWRLREWFPKLDERTHERLRIFHLELLRWDSKINLISSSTREHSDRIHFADCVLGCQIIMENLVGAKEVWDLGSGNGFPGAVFNILNPQIGVICVEAEEKKAAFLKTLGVRLELDNLAVRKQRIEEIPSDSMKHGITRALGSIDKVLLLCNKQFMSGGEIYHFKGPESTKEINSVSRSLCSTWNNSSVKQYTLPQGEELRQNQKPEELFIVKSAKK